MIYIYIHSYIHILDIYIYSLYMAVCILYVRADNCDNQVLLQELITLITWFFKCFAAENLW